MEIRPAAQLMSDYRKQSLFSFEHFPEHIIEHLMRQYAQQAVRMALEEAAKNAKILLPTHPHLHGTNNIDYRSILSLESSIIKKLK